MKKTVYTKAGQVGLVEVERPQIEAPDDVILRIVSCRIITARFLGFYDNTLRRFPAMRGENDGDGRR